MYDEFIVSLLRTNARRVTNFISEKEIVRVTRTSFRGRFSRGNLELTITRGKPNFIEREKRKKLGKAITGMTFYWYLAQKKKNPKRKQK